MNIRILTLGAIMALSAATAAYAFDVTDLRGTPANSAAGTLSANGFNFSGKSDEDGNTWDMWFNRSTRECVGFTRKGGDVKRARSFDKDACRQDNDRHSDRDSHSDHADGDVPGWMVGYFRGHNRAFGADVSLDISRDGSVVATVNGKRMVGEYRNGKLRIGFSKFYVERDSDGLTTRQTDNQDNVVHYRRR
jgi:hypothetical protein